MCWCWPGTGADRFADLTPVAGSITVEPRGWTEADLTGAVLALGDIADPDESARFIAAAHAAGAQVNMIDRTELCDVLFGTVVNRSPVVVGISTDGAAPALGQSVRVRIESVLPPGLARWAETARAWRPRVKATIAAFGDRRRFWQRFAKRAWDAIDRAPGESDFAALLAGDEAGRGSVTLVGAGPGDPELLTLKAVRALQTATVILYDDLVSPEVLELARREATRIAVGKRGGGPSVRQADICCGDRPAGAGRRDGGAAEGRRPRHLRPRDRGDRRLPRRWRSGRYHSRHHRGAGGGRVARHLADRARPRAPRSSS